MIKAEYSNDKTFSTKVMVSTAVLIAITFVMMHTPIGRIPNPIASATISHMPTLIAVMVFGLRSGLMVGFSFGAASLFTGITSPIGILGPLFANPLVSILPRVLIPITTYFAYKALTSLFSGWDKKSLAAGAISSVIGSFTNTAGVAVMLYLVYAQRITEGIGSPARNLVVTIITTNGVAEAIAMALLVPPIVLVLRRVVK